MKIHPLPTPLQLKEEGRVVRVVGTRVSLDTIVRAFEDGNTPEEIALQYDSVPLADIYLTVGYYLSHRTEVREYLERRRIEAEALRREIEAKNDTAGIRERLLARQARLGRTA